MLSKAMRKGNRLIYLYLVMHLELSGFIRLSIILIGVLKIQSKAGS